MAAQASPGPGARALFVIATITVGIAMCPISGGAWLLWQSRSPVLHVGAAAALDERAVPGGTFVAVPLTPDPASVTEFEGGTSGYLCNDVERRLVFYAPSGTDLAAALRDHAPPPREVAGRIWDLGDYSHMSSEVDEGVVDQQVEATFGAHPPAGIRVVEVGSTPGHEAFIGSLSVCTCGVPLLLLALYAAVRGFRAMLAGRP